MDAVQGVLVQPYNALEFLEMLEGSAQDAFLVPGAEYGDFALNDGWVAPATQPTPPQVREATCCLACFWCRPGPERCSPSVCHTCVLQAGNTPAGPCHARGSAQEGLFVPRLAESTGLTDNHHDYLNLAIPCGVFSVLPAEVGGRTRL